MSQLLKRGCRYGTCLQRQYRFLAPSSKRARNCQESEHHQRVEMEESSYLRYTGCCFCPSSEDLSSRFCAASIHFFVVEVRRSSEHAADICTPVGGAKPHESVRTCALSLQIFSCLACPSLPRARAETLPACPCMKQESVTSQTAFCTCFAGGVLAIQPSYQPNDAVLPFCELRCADSSLLVSARIYFFPRPITCFIKLSRTI